MCISFPLHMQIATKNRVLNQLCSLTTDGRCPIDKSVSEVSFIKSIWQPNVKHRLFYQQQSTEHRHFSEEQQNKISIWCVAAICPNHHQWFVYPHCCRTVHRLLLLLLSVNCINTTFTSFHFILHFILADFYHLFGPLMSSYCRQFKKVSTRRRRVLLLPWSTTHCSSSIYNETSVL